MTTATMTPEQMQIEIDALRRQIANTKASKAKNGLRVSEKGAVSVYGLGRFPVTLYREQMEKLLNMADDIRAFVTANDAALVRKSAS